MAIGNNIRKLRIEKNYSQQYAADNLQIDKVLDAIKLIDKK
jgi:transcriptional regulator with XRE-family HTH domain